MDGMKPARAMEFIISCLAQAEADGYQQFEEDGNITPDDATPNEWFRPKPCEVRLVFGEEEFVLTLRRAKRA